MQKQASYGELLHAAYCSTECIHLAVWGYYKLYNHVD